MRDQNREFKRESNGEKWGWVRDFELSCETAMFDIMKKNWTRRTTQQPKTTHAERFLRMNSLWLWQANKSNFLIWNSWSFFCPTLFLYCIQAQHEKCTKWVQKKDFNRKRTQEEPGKNTFLFKRFCLKIYCKEWESCLLKWIVFVWTHTRDRDSNS